MKNYTNFKESKTEEIDGYTVLYMNCDQGVDWYDAVKTFSDNTYKVQYDNNGVINSITRDASRLTPLDYSVLEVAVLPASHDVLFSGREWVVEDGKIVPKIFSDDELIAEATELKARLLSEASEVIAPLNDAVELNIATDEEAAKLLVWKKYRVLLNRVDTSTAPDIEWPELPANS